jgi:hypothetical protein
MASECDTEAAMSAEPNIDQLYEQQIKALPRAAKLRLLARITEDVTNSDAEKTLSIMGLHGLGAEIWNGIDAQNYVNRLRDEWDRG